MKIIALSGKKRAGKDSVYEAVVKYYEDTRLMNEIDPVTGVPKIGRVGFADALKHEVSEITGFRAEFIEEHKQRFRSLLQVWGTEFRRHFCGNDYWINKMAEILEKSKDHFDLIFITDLRFKNEAEFVKGNGGYVVKVERRQVSYKDLSELEGPDDHVSENDMNDYSNFDYVLNNDKTQEELAKAVEEMILTLKIFRNES